MSDLIYRLRETARKGVSAWGDLQMEAADKIEHQAIAIEYNSTAADRLLAEVERLTKENATLTAERDELRAKLSAAETELSRVREKAQEESLLLEDVCRNLVALEKQEPISVVSNATIDEFLEDYEMICENEDGVDCYYLPTENDKALIKDAMLGFFSDAPSKLYAAAGAAPAPEGWQLVPVKPTDEMCEAAWESEGTDYVGEYHRIHRADLAYKAMLAAAPKE